MFRWVSKSGIFIQVAVYAALLAILWISAFVNALPVVTSPADGPLFTAFACWLKAFPIFSVSIALALVVLQSIIIYFVFKANGFFGRRNFLPAIILVLAYSWNTEYQALHALLPANLFLIIALYAMMVMYGRQAAFHQVFTSSFAIGIASLFYIPSAYMLLMIWFSFITYRVSTWREYVISVIGFSLPYLYFASWLFWNENLLEGFNLFISALFIMPNFERLTVIEIVWFSYTGFALIFAILTVLNIMGDKLISLRRRAWVLFNFSFCALIAVLLTGCHIIPGNSIFVVPFSFFVTGSLVLMKRPLWAEIICAAALLLFIFMRIYPLI